MNHPHALPIFGLVAGALLVLQSPSRAAEPGPALLPYDRSNPVMYDNDWSNDYVDWYLMALAGAKHIKYRGMSTSSSIAPYNRHMPAADYDKSARNRAAIVAEGRKSGFRNVPNAVRGTRGHLAKPASGKIEDTVPLASAASEAIIREARKATPKKPLVVCLGGPATVVANAYLLDNTIADRVVVAFVDNHSDGMTGFNGWSDGWAAYITLEKLRLVHFPIYPPGSPQPIPRLSKQWIKENLSDSPAKTHMLSLELDVVNGDSGDADGIGAVSVAAAAYVQAVKRVSFGGWKTSDGHEMPLFKDDPNGRALVVTRASGEVASQEYERAFKNYQYRVAPR